MTLTHQLMGIHLCTRYCCEVPTLPRAMGAKNLYGKCQVTLSSLLVYRLVHALVTTFRARESWVRFPDRECGVEIIILCWVEFIT